MKYKEFIKHLKSNDCYLAREGASHEVWRKDPDKQSTVPRHKKLAKGTCRAICKQLDIPSV